MVEAAEVQNLHETCIRKDIKCHNLNLKMGILRVSVTSIPNDNFQGLRQVTKHLFFLLQLIERLPTIYEVDEEEET
jgi:hypothetical protein